MTPPFVYVNPIKNCTALTLRKTVLTWYNKNNEKRGGTICTTTTLGILIQDITPT
jgi:hypothetical protein